MSLLLSQKGVYARGAPCNATSDSSDLTQILCLLRDGSQSHLLCLPPKTIRDCCALRECGRPTLRSIFQSSRKSARMIWSESTKITFRRLSGNRTSRNRILYAQMILCFSVCGGQKALQMQQQITDGLPIVTHCHTSTTATCLCSQEGHL